MMSSTSSNNSFDGQKVTEQGTEMTSVSPMTLTRDVDNHKPNTTKVAFSTLNLEQEGQQQQQQDKNSTLSQPNDHHSLPPPPTNCYESRGYLRRFVIALAKVSCLTKLFFPCCQNIGFGCCVSVKKYTDVLVQNRNYRLYFLSHICQHAGDWFVRVAALLAVERLAPGNATALAIMIMTKMVPEVFLSPFGGIVADTFDRRKLMLSEHRFIHSMNQHLRASYLCLWRVTIRSKR
mmetsp:Transcript_21764/g.30535  ORF Transcript_21764/g.30535 Transcript_21764/m.30535 type:complete len:234 (-) Transcript_21764:132-833(-)